MGIAHSTEKVEPIICRYRNKMSHTATSLGRLYVHVHAIKLLKRAAKTYERELVRIEPLRDKESIEELKSRIASLQATIKHLEQ